MNPSSGISVITIRLYILRRLNMNKIKEKEKKKFWDHKSKRRNAKYPWPIRISM